MPKGDTPGGRRVYPLRPIAWSAALTVGIPAIDEDHKYVLDLINALANIHEHLLPASLEHALDRLIIFAHIHFHREERVFEAAGIPLDLAHHADHEHIKNFVAEMRTEVAFHASSTEHALGVVDYLFAWAAQHMNDHDGKLRTVDFDKDYITRVAREAAPPVRYLIGIH